MLWRWNFALALLRERVPRTKVALTDLQNRAGDANGVIAHLYGRSTTGEERATFAGVSAPVALALAAPAFQYH